MVGGYSVNLSVPCPLSALDSCPVLRGIQCCPPVWGWLGSVDVASTFDLSVTQQGLVGAVTQWFPALPGAPLCTGVCSLQVGEVFQGRMFTSPGGMGTESSQPLLGNPWLFFAA